MEGGVRTNGGGKKREIAPLSGRKEKKGNLNARGNNLETDGHPSSRRKEVGRKSFQSIPGETRKRQN